MAELVVCEILLPQRLNPGLSENVKVLNAAELYAQKWLKWKTSCCVHFTVIKVYIKLFPFKMYMAEKI